MDSLGEKVAKKHNIPLKIFPADWNKHGKSAGYKRNAEMSVYGDVLLAIQENRSKGTGHMIDLMRRKNKKSIHFGN